MNLTRRQFIRSIFGTAVTFRFHRFSSAHEKSISKPNILLMVGEDHGLQLSCYGDKYISTPNLDRLAETGVRFVHAYVTQAGCSPSRASIFTGQYPHNHGQIGLAIHGLRMYKNDTPNLTTYLKEAGYRTGTIGKIHVNPESAFLFDSRAFPKSNFNNRSAREFARTAGKFFQASNDPFLMWIKFELYDLQNDPWEFHNLADDPGYTKQLILLKRRLAEWQQRTNDPLRHKHILAKFTAENDATMISGKYIRKKSGQWKYPKYFLEGNDM